MYSHDIYVATSWKNTEQPTIVELLREHGHAVYDFRNPKPNDHGFSWKEISEYGNPKDWNVDIYRKKILTHPTAVRGFNNDMMALRECTACVLVLPCGRSAHLELGYAVDRKLTIVYMPNLEEPELMYKACNHIVTDYKELVEVLAKSRPR